MNDNIQVVLTKDTSTLPRINRADLDLFAVYQAPDTRGVVTPVILANFGHATNNSTTLYSVSVEIGTVYTTSIGTAQKILRGKIQFQKSVPTGITTAEPLSVRKFGDVVVTDQAVTDNRFHQLLVLGEDRGNSVLFDTFDCVVRVLPREVFGVHVATHYFVTEEV